MAAVGRRTFWDDFGQRLVNVHRKRDCRGRSCTIHRPSDHSMRDFPIYWRADRGIFERICEHGVGHPDPDNMAYLASIGADAAQGVHGCDGCCGSVYGAVVKL